MVAKAKHKVPVEHHATVESVPPTEQVPPAEHLPPAEHHDAKGHHRAKGHHKAKEHHKTAAGGVEQFKVKLPPGLKPLLEELTRAVILKKPTNIVLFAADFFNRKIEERAREAGPRSSLTYLDEAREKALQHVSSKDDLSSSDSEPGGRRGKKSSKEDLQKNNSRKSDKYSCACDSPYTLPDSYYSSKDARSRRRKDTKDKNTDSDLT